MPEPSPDGKERLARFLAILLFEGSEETLSRALLRVNEGENPPSLTLIPRVHGG